MQHLHAGVAVSKINRIWAACNLGSGDYLKLKDELFEQESVESLYSKVLEFQQSNRKVQ